VWLVVAGGTVLATGVLGVGLWAAGAFGPARAPTTVARARPTKPRPAPPAGSTVEAREAGQHVGETATIQVRVEHVGKSRDGFLVFLNSESDWKSPTNFTAVLSAGAQAQLREQGVADPEAHFLRTTVRVQGKIELYQDRPQIRVDKLSQLETLPDD